MKKPRVDDIELQKYLSGPSWDHLVALDLRDARKEIARMRSALEAALEEIATNNCYYGCASCVEGVLDQE